METEKGSTVNTEPVGRSRGLDLVLNRARPCQKGLPSPVDMCFKESLVLEL